MNRSKLGFSKVGGRVTMVIALLAGVLAAPACASTKEGKSEPPAKPPAKPPAAYGDVCAATGLAPIFVNSPGICPEEVVGYGTCLEPEDWYTDGNETYDVWYCEKAGDIITLCACGDDFTCNDTGTGIVCEG